MKGHVYLIGAGPGDPGLLTLRGAELLGRADVVLFDGLSNAELLRHAPQADHICVGKHGQSRIWRQDEIIAEILRHAESGKTVARLKGGDPAVFARTAEEVDAIRDAGIQFEIVPGITAALAAGSYAGVPVTHRGLASAVALVTGHEEPNKQQSALDWDALARFPGTLVVYMGVTTVEAWTGALLKAGKPPETPAAIVRRCSLPDQQTLTCRLDEVTDHLTPASNFRPPVIVILGPVAELAETLSWVQERPLFGKTVLVTRPVEESQGLAAPLRELGANVVIQPAIRIGPPADWGQVDEAIGNLASFDLIVFCSRNGVRFFMNRLWHLGKDARDLASTRIAVVGSKTANSLAQFHLRADIVPQDFHSASLLRELGTDVRGQRILVVRASRGRNDLSEGLTTAGADVTQSVAYCHSDVDQPEPEIAVLAERGKIDWLTVTSSATAESVVRMFGGSIDKMRIASLSPVTTETIQRLGYQVEAEANPYTIESLVEAIQEATNR